MKLLESYANPLSEKKQTKPRFGEKTDSIIENPCLYLIEELKKSIDGTTEQQEIILKIINDSGWEKPEQGRASGYISKHEFYGKMTGQLDENGNINRLACIVMLGGKNGTINSSLEKPGKYNYINMFK